MSNATIIAAAFGEGANLYDILGISSSPTTTTTTTKTTTATTTTTTTAAQLRKAYYRKSLQCHPDKVAGKEEEFQALTVAYNILKNEDSRREYDATGELVDDDEDIDSNSFDAMKNYFSSIFGQVTTNKIDLFAEKYKCSEEEESDVLKYYRQFKGHLGKMLENVMLSTEKDAERWVEDYLSPAMIASREIPDYNKTLRKTLATCLKKAQQEVDDEEEMEDDDVVAVVDQDATESDATESDHDDRGAATQQSNKKKTTTKKKVPAKKAKPPAKKMVKKKKQTKAQREAEEAEALMAKIQGRSSSSSSLTIGQQGYSNVLNGLSSKYGGSVLEDDDPLDDAAFAKIQAGMAKKKKGRQGKK